MYRDDEICGFHIELLDNFEQGIYSNLPENIYKTMLFDDKIMILVYTVRYVINYL